VTRWRWLWVAWLAIFLVIEVPAIVNDTPGDTLSETVWAVVRVPVVWWVLAGFLVWLVVHLLGPQVRRWLRTWRRTLP